MKSIKRMSFVGFTHASLGGEGASYQHPLLQSIHKNKKSLLPRLRIIRNHLPICQAIVKIFLLFTSEYS